MLQQRKKQIEAVFLVIPLLLYTMVLFLFTVSGFKPSQERLMFWSKLQHAVLWIYALAIPGLIVIWFQETPRNIRSFLGTFKKWAIGLILTLFSYALAGITSDLLLLFFLIEHALLFKLGLV